MNVDVCPFCGGSVRIYELRLKPGTWIVQCDKAEGHDAWIHGDSKPEAIEKWNHRTSDYATKLREAEQEIAYLNSRLNGRVP